MSHRIFVEREEELLNGFLAEAVLDPDDGSEAKKTAYLYKKEKELVYCSLFVVARLSIGEEEPRAICAPLLIHPAEITERHPHVFLKPDFDNRRLNYHLLDALEGDSGQRRLSQQTAELSRNWPLGAEQVFELAALLEETVPELNASALRDYPKLVSQRGLQDMFARMREQGGRPLAVASSAAAIVNRSVETRGVVNELSEMAEGESLSEPLQVLFATSPTRSVTRKPRLGRVPALLNKAQQTIIELGATMPLTLVIGPPGTGKSFTIAALAAESLSRRQSVLVASRMNHAVDVVGDKIERQLGIAGCVVRGGRKQYLKDLKQYLVQLLAGMHTVTEDQSRDQRRIEKDVTRLEGDVDQLERRIRRRNLNELSWGRSLSRTGTGLWRSMRSSYIGYRVSRSVHLWRLLDELQRLLDQRLHKTTELLQLLNRRRLREALGKHRKQFRTFLHAIRARTGVKQEDLFQQIDFPTLFTALPIWLVNLADIHDVLPLKKELFDLAIIDEATQCDIASCLPILQRARRVVITGDPNQLRHLSFLPQSRQKELLAKHGVPAEQEHHYDYRGKSILDFVNDALPSQGHVVFLDEHYRSLPPIIQFSNRRYYADSLRVMTEKPGTPATDALTLCCGAGRRNRSGVNEEEAHRLISDCLQQIESEQSLGRESRRSVGILSPFRSQVDYISDQIAKSLPLAALDRHDVLIGTAHTFQGEERDLVYLSLAVDSSTHPAALRFLEKPDVFNVSITRARVAQRVYTSVDANHLPADSLLGAYLRHIDDSRKQAEPSNSNAQRDRFLSEVEEALKGLGCRTWPGYPIAGMLLDLVAARDGRSCGVDLVGYPGAYESAFPLERYKMFHRAGLRIVPLPYTLWRTRRDLCLLAVTDALSGGNP
ncbi:MAG TPA: AAA domain-containing protein [Blastocatellia bacterium]|nr:AAA domain-containing protein [Blastocatellia bacterium]